ncbi:MAG: OadG family protein [Bacteroidales bacterium]|nr:OadG family protein [Bacteroidales bacterium]
MTTFLYSLLPLTAGGDRMAQIDPHGWTLTLVSVSVVFSALIILYFIYNFSGNLFSGKFKRKPKAPKAAKGEISGEVAAAIAMALEAEAGGEAEAAIATALHLYLSDAIHDVEPGIITIRRTPSPWDNKQLNFRKSLRK